MGQYQIELGILYLRASIDTKREVMCSESHLLDYFKENTKEVEQKLEKKKETKTERVGKSEECKHVCVFFFRVVSLLIVRMIPAIDDFFVSASSDKNSNRANWK